MSVRFHTLKVAEIVPETAEANSIRFEIPPELRDEFAFKAGQHLTLLLPLIPIALPHLTEHFDFSGYAIFSALSLVNWKYLLAGFILFRVFDIWKPFPIRRLEKLPHGWGVMADDWAASVYAAILLRLALHFNLV